MPSNEVWSVMSKDALGRTLRQIRIAYGLTRAEFADFLSVDRSLYCKIEAGRIGVSSALALKLQQRTGMRVRRRTIYELTGDSFREAMRRAQGYRR